MGKKESNPVRPNETRVLLTDTNRWALAARLAVALAESGCEVGAVCPTPSHALTKTRAVSRVFRYSAFRPIDCLGSAIEEFSPNIVVPACDRSVEHLHELYARAKARGNEGAATATLIERSLGSPGSHAIVSSRYDLLAVAREEGIRVPNTSSVNSVEDFNRWRRQEQLPWVIKADGTWGGVGVRVLRSEEGFEQSWSELTQMSRLTRALKRLAVNRDQFLLSSWWNGLTRKLIIQSYIDGRPANCSAFAWKGRVLALIGVEVIRSDGATGPASIVRVVENSEMKLAAMRIASSLGLSGFFGLDFMIENGSRAVYLIEMNPRLTPPCHLRLGPGRDLIGAFCAQLKGEPIYNHPAVTQSSIIAYQSHTPGLVGDSFPDCYHDFPHDDSELARELLNPFPDRTILFRLVRYLSRKPATDGVFENPHGSTTEAPTECIVADTIAGNIATPIEKVRVRSS